MWGSPHFFWVNLGVSAALLAIAVYLMVGPAQHRLVRVTRAHRWETFLMLGIPAGTGCLVAMHLWSSVSVPLWGWSHVVKWLALAVLVATYPAIRRYGHELLTTLWGFTIAMAAIGLVAGLGAAFARSPGEAFPLPIVLFKFPTDSWAVGEAYFGPLVYFSLRDALRLVVMFWFIRRAARVSIAHAFLLLGLSMSDRSFDISQLWPFLHGLDAIPVAAAHLAAQVALNVLLLWALIRHETFTASVLRATAAATIAASGLAPLIGSVLWRAITVWPITSGVEAGNVVFSPPGVLFVAVRSVIGLLPVLVLGYLYARTVRPRIPHEETRGGLVPPG